MGCMKHSWTMMSQLRYIFLRCAYHIEENNQCGWTTKQFKHLSFAIVYIHEV